MIEFLLFVKIKFSTDPCNSFPCVISNSCPSRTFYDICYIYCLLCYEPSTYVVLDLNWLWMWMDIFHIEISLCFLGVYLLDVAANFSSQQKSCNIFHKQTLLIFYVCLIHDLLNLNCSEMLFHKNCIYIFSYHCELFQYEISNCLLFWKAYCKFHRLSRYHYSS